MDAAIPTLRFDVRGDRTRSAHLLLAASGVAALLLFGASVWHRTAESPTSTMTGVQTAALVLANTLEIAAACAVAAWAHRAYANLAHLDASHESSPFSAALSFVVPFVNLAAPRKVLGEIWRGSEAPSLRTLTRPPSRPVAIVTMWFGVFAASTIAANLAVFFGSRAQQQYSADTLMLFAAAGSVIAAFAGIDAIRMIDSRQALRRSTLARTPAAAAPPRMSTREVAMPVVAPPVAPRTAEPRPAVAQPIAPRPVAPPPVVAPPIDDAPIAPLEITHKIPAGLSAPSSFPISFFFVTAAVLALLNAVIALGVVFFPVQERENWLGLKIVTFPTALLMYLVTIAGFITFAIWVSRAYSNLRAYVPQTPRVHFDALGDFLRRAGDPAVVEEICVITMSASETSTLSRLESWGSTWRALQIAFAAGLVATMLTRGRVAALLLGVSFLIWFRASLLTRRVARDVSRAQRAHLATVSSASPDRTR